MDVSTRTYGLLGVVLIGIFAVSLFSLPSASDADEPPQPAPDVNPAVADTATFAGGCFWCMEPPYDKLDGVASTTSGFAGGEQVDPSYREVANGTTNYTEVVQVVYDSTQVSYDRLVRVYWHNVDPFDGTGQFCDRGSQYRPAIFAHDDRQYRRAKDSKEVVASRFDQKIAVNVQRLQAFYAAETYHQNYYKKNPRKYKNYRTGCGRDDRLREIWGEAAGSDAPLAAR